MAKFKIYFSDHYPPSGSIDIEAENNFDAEKKFNEMLDGDRDWIYRVDWDEMMHNPDWQLDSIYQVKEKE